MTATLLVSLACGVLADEDESKMTEGIEQQWLKTLVSVEIIPDKGDPKAVGTAFLVTRTNNHTLLVTAKHVILNADGQLRTNLAYRFNQNNGPAALVPESHMLSYAQGWFLSTTADVACRFIVFGDNFDILRLPESQFLPVARVQPGAPVLVPGFPLGIRSAEHAKPIVRRGIVARADADNLILDAFVFPGNSGGPVIYVPTIKVSGGLIKVPFVNRERVIGLVSSSISYIDTAVSQQTQRPRVTFEENSGLCNVVPIDAVLALLNRADVKQLDAVPDLRPK